MWLQFQRVPSTSTKDVVDITGKPPPPQICSNSKMFLLGFSDRKNKRLMVHSGKSSTKSVKESITGNRTDRLEENGWKLAISGGEDDDIQRDKCGKT